LKGLLRQPVARNRARAREGRRPAAGGHFVRSAAWARVRAHTSRD
jgi:hypothetical protein